MARTYRKKINLVLETKAQNKDEAKTFLNEVAHSVHSLGHPLTIGGKANRVVTVDHKSTPITFIPKHKLGKK